MKSKIFFNTSLLFISMLFFSCASKKDILYLQDADSHASTTENVIYEPKLQKDDLLSIIVSAEQPELTIPFNMPQVQGNYQVNENQDGIKTYLIDAYGYIQFPIVGKIKLAGLTRAEAVKLIEDSIK